MILENAMDFEKVKKLLKTTYDEWSEDHIQREAGSLAFFTIFSLAPTLVIALAVGGVIMERDDLKAALFEWISNSLSSQAANVLQGMLSSAAETDSGLATIVSVAFLLVSGTTLIYHLRKVMNKIWYDENNDLDIERTIKNRIVALGVAAVLGLLLVGMVAVDSILPSYLGNYFVQNTFGLSVAEIVSKLISFFAFTALFAAVFKWLPSVEIEWGDVILGAILTSILFIFGQILVDMYIDKGSATSAYGAAGTFAAILVWIFYTMIVLLTGAEFTQVYAHLYGSKKDKPLPED